MNRYLVKIAAGYGQFISGSDSASGAQTAADRAASLPAGGGAKPRGASTAAPMDSPSMMGSSMRMNAGSTGTEEHTMKGGDKFK